MADHGGRPDLLALDERGKERLAAWEARASVADQNRVAMLLDEIQRRRDWKTDWAANADPFERHDWIVWIATRLVVVVREFSDEDPQNMFSIWVGPEPEDLEIDVPN